MSLAHQHIAAGNSPAKKSTVAQTCNQLSLFLKQKGCLRDLRLGINPKFDDSVKPPVEKMTLDLLSNLDNPDQKTASQTPEDIVNKPNSGRSVITPSEAKPAPMTIIYDGQVMVFDEIPADRARDVILAAAGTDSSKIHPSGVRESNQLRIQTNGLDLPIARRASLHKFLSKRKDRATMRAPYQLHSPSPAAGNSNDGHKFDLNL